MNTNTNTAGRAKGAKATTNTTTTKATKATTTKAAKMDAAAVVSAAAALILKYKTIAGIKATAASLREKYGAHNWEAILREAKAIRARAVEEAAKAAKAGVFQYRVVLGAMFKELAKDANFKKLCAIAKAAYKGTDKDAAARLVAEYYTAVDATTGAPLQRVDFYKERAALIYTAYMPKELTDKAALDILKAALAGLAKASRTATRKAEDTARAILDNTYTAGAIVAVAEAKTEAGLISRGVILAGAGAPKTAPKEYARAAKSAAALIGHAVPEDARRVSELNAATRAAEAEAARAALARERAALKEDATAAGVKTAPKGRKEAPKEDAKTKAARERAAASMAAIDAAIRANNAESAPALNA